MPAESRNLHEQESSIKAREHELYVKPSSPDDQLSLKPFPEYLRETPAEPLSTTTKTLLWIVAVLVGFVFLAAIWRVIRRHSARPRQRAAPPAPKSAALAHHLSRRLAIAKAFGYLV
jgi:hypothetical protein